MALSVGKKHWSERVLESVIAKTTSHGNPPTPSRLSPGAVSTLPGLNIAGGAENGLFPFFSNIQQERVIYHSGKLYKEDLLLEINGQTVAGLTLYDLQTIISCAADPLTIKHVKENYGIQKELRKYLSKRFEKDSIDNNLQALIRDNLYLRTLPCTTRQPRQHETHGVDYEFLSVDEFQEMEKAGELLESGVYDQNYYGTPKPPKEPPINDDMDSNPIGTNIVENDVKPASVLQKKQAFEAQNIQVQKIGPELEKRESRNSEELTLPDGWEKATTESGKDYFIDHNTKLTSWEHPALINLDATDKPTSDLKLPDGWEQVTDENHGTYFIDHINRRTTYSPPPIYSDHTEQNSTPNPKYTPSFKPMMNSLAIQKSNKGNTVSNSSVNNAYNINQFSSPEQTLEHGKTLQILTTSNNINVQSNNKIDVISQQPQQQQQKQEKQQFQNTTTTSTQNINSQNNIPQTSNWIHTLPSPVVSQPEQFHPDLPKPPSPPQANPVLERFNLEGELFDIVIQKKDSGFGFTIIGGDEPDELIQIKSVVHSMYNSTEQVQPGDVIVAVNDEYVVGYSHTELVKLFQNIPIGSSASIKLCRGYPLPEEDESPENLTPENIDYGEKYGYSSKPQILTKTIIKGAKGFGFNLRKHSNGKFFIHSISATELHSTLQEGDIILRIDHKPISSLSHDQVVQMCQLYDVDSEVFLTIQRSYSSDDDHRDTTVSSINPGNGIHPSPPPSSISQQIQTVFPDKLIVLKKKDTGFGFRIAKTANKTLIGDININGAADEDGNLERNDELITIDGQRIQGYTHADVIKLMAGASKTGTVTLGVRKQKRKSITMTYQRNEPMSHYNGFTNDQEVFVNLRRSPKEGFGFVVITCEKATRNYVHRIGEIVHPSPAANCGQLQITDRIVSVNGSNLSHLDHNAVVQLITKAGTSVRLGIVMGNAVGDLEQNHNMIYDVLIHRGSNGSFGFGLRGGSEYGMKLYVLRLAPGGPANNTNPVMRVGDRVLEINEVSCEDPSIMSHKTAINLIRSGGTELRLKCLRGDGTVPEVVLNSNIAQRSLSNKSTTSSSQLQM